MAVESVLLDRAAVVAELARIENKLLSVAYRLDQLKQNEKPKEREA